MKISKVLRCLWLTVVVSFSAISANASDEAGSAAPTIDRDLIHQGWPLNPAVKELDLPGVFFPESIAADYWGSLYVSSIATGEIVRFTPFSSTPEVFIPVGTNTNSTGVLVDHRRWVLWSCNVDLSMQTPSDLRAFDLWSGELLASYLIPDFGLCADMTLGRNGSLYVTDTLLARVLKLTTPSRYSAENGQLAIWAEDPVLVGDPAVFLKINGIAYSRSGSIYTTNYSTGTLYEIPINRDGSAGEVAIINTDQALVFPDGIRMLGRHNLLIAQNSGSVVRVRLSGSEGKIIPVKEGMDQPSSLVQLWGQLWVTEGQILRLVGIDPSPINLPFKVKKIALH